MGHAGDTIAEVDTKDAVVPQYWQRTKDNTVSQYCPAIQRYLNCDVISIPCSVNNCEF
jgi:hypothetical protein